MARTGTVLVTGASGFVGSAVARRLREAGFAVRALVRLRSPTTHLAELGLDFVTGDLRDPASLRDALAGVRYLFHVAADYRMWARNPQEMIDTNVAGTRALMQEALRAGVERVVYTSSVATLAARTDGVSADESMPLDDCLHSLFGASKVAADILVQEYGRYFGMRTACFRGGCLTGPAHSGTTLHGFLAYLMRCIVEGRPYVIHGYQGKQVRDNIHSADLVAAFVAAEI